MTTLTTEQLDELERSAESVPWMDSDLLLRLVAIARAALAWTTASREAAVLRVQWAHTNDDTLLPRIERLDKTIVAERLAMDIALQGTP